jgi:hypothetical protein
MGLWKPGDSTQTEGNRIGLGHWLLTSRLGNGVGGFDSPTYRFDMARW